MGKSLIKQCQYHPNIIFKYIIIILGSKSEQKEFCQKLEFKQTQL